MAGAGYRVWTPGEVITADNVQQYLQDQSVQVYADSTARETALTGYLAEGMISYLQDSNSVSVYNGSSWVGLGGDAPIFTQGTSGQFLKSIGTAGVVWDTVPTPSAATPTAQGIVYARNAGTTTGSALTAFGYNAGPLNYDMAGQTGSTYIGFEAGKLAYRGGNTGVGHSSLASMTTGRNNTALGWLSMDQATSALQNTALGYSTLRACISGQNNTAVGVGALGNKTGSFDTAIGNSAGIGQTTGQLNTFVGYAAAPGDASTGSSNTFLGAETGFIRAMNGSNNTLIGWGALHSSTSVSNEMTLGNNSLSVIRSQVTSISSLSDERDKKNIADLDYGLDFLNKLRPVKFDWWQRKPEPMVKPDGSVHEIDEATLKRNIPDIGFIAQEIVELEDSYDSHDRLKLSYRSNPESLEVTQGRLIPILVKAVQELSAEVESLKAQLAK